jgi:predicted nucleic acid-binding Zn ribbon protein
MRRLAPRPLAAALEGVLERAEPATTLARVQSVWRSVAGSGLADLARPVAERDGVVTLACESAVWANELELLAPELLPRLNAALAESGERADGATALRRLRCVVGSGPNRS